MMTDKVTLREKIGYGFGDAASSMFWKIFTFYLAIFYTDVFGIPAAVAGTMFLLTRIWDTANDPIMGIIGDRTNTRWGKFRPYLLWVSVPFAIIGVLLFTTPNLGITGKIVYAYISYTIMMMAYTAINVPYASLLGVMTAKSEERTSLASYRMVFAFGGSLLVVAMFQPLVDWFSKSIKPESAYQLTMVVIGAIVVVFFFFTFLWTCERITPPKSQNNNLREDV
ncbi:MAG TPA: MFS transporter, partial [Prolixibacteraceae bacterium]|nr:MFS transporter [Prolixibacteraceae bacterium]